MDDYNVADILLCQMWRRFLEPEVCYRLDCAIIFGYIEEGLVQGVFMVAFGDEVPLYCLHYELNKAVMAR